MLSLHGAGVDALGQARSYSPRPDFRVVAPTNRRPFGFDWQDFGRLDAYESLDRARRRFGEGSARTFLTGHSMGGHGTWHLAVNDPDRWTAIAPSAGWCSFDTYAGGPRPETPLSAWWSGCDGGSRTEDRIGNLAPLPTLIVHGKADDNVPFSEAEGMLARLRAAGAHPGTLFVDGMGHWWDGDAAPGADCVDHPAIFSFFRGTPAPVDPLSLDFVTVDPSIDAEHFWVTVEQPIEYGKPSRVRGAFAEGRAALTTENVRSLVVRGPRDAGLLDLTLDGQSLTPPVEAVRARAVRDGEAWRLEAICPAGEKGPGFSGPFKRAFDRGFVLVVGTKGTPSENREMLEVARYHSEQWWYRANGAAPVVRDTDVLAAKPHQFAKRNLILYGNADVNAAWAKVFPADIPVAARRGAIRVGDREFTGDRLGAVFVHPRADAPGCLAGAFASTGPAGTRLAYGLPVFVSGVGYPDYAVFCDEFLVAGDRGVIAAGWFDHRWKLQPGGFLLAPGGVSGR